MNSVNQKQKKECLIEECQLIVLQVESESCLVLNITHLKSENGVEVSLLMIWGVQEGDLKERKERVHKEELQLHKEGKKEKKVY